MAELTALRDEVYTRINVKKSNSQFIVNDFAVEKDRWLPSEGLEGLKATYPNGLLNVIGGCLGDMKNLGRQPLANREYSVHISFQKVINGPADPSIDTLVTLLEQLDLMCLSQIANSTNRMTPSRIEYLKDEHNLPIAYVLLRQGSCFSALFSAYYLKPLQ